MAINWGPTGEVVYDRTYSRTHPDGTKETWPETVDRVVHGNLDLVQWPQEASEYYGESVELSKLMEDFSLIPAGRHLWASGVKGRQFLFNCHVSGWGEKPSSHFEFSFMRLMEGGGVGANYSMDLIGKYGPVRTEPRVHIVCDPMHQDYADMKAAGLLSEHYSPSYQGRYMEVEDSREGWAAALVELIETAYNDDAWPVRVYDVSRVRCKGSRIKTFGGTASGPGPLARMLLDVQEVFAGLEGMKLSGLDAMDIDHAIAQCVVSGGNRRSARMSIMNWQDPWIEQFLKCKEDSEKHWTTNISVEVDEEFFECLNGCPEGGPDCDGAKQTLKLIAEGMIKNGEPGIWNAALNNEDELERVRASNPCGEIALQEWENCNLGHLNLERFVTANPASQLFPFDLPAARAAIRLMTRFLIRATYGDVTDSKQAAILAKNRRIGVGLFGFQAMCVKMGIKYSASPTDPYIKYILRQLKDTVRQEATDYAYQLRIPVPIKCTTLAPTGTIAKMPGTTEGGHPIFAKYFIRRVRFSSVNPGDVFQVEALRKEGYKVYPADNEPFTDIVEFPTMEKLVQEVIDLGWSADIVESSNELTLEEMFAVQALFQENYADNAVSFTANFVNDGEYTHTLADILADWLPKLKGTTVFPDISRPQSPYERITKEQYEEMTGPKVVSDSIDEDCASGACPVR